MKTKTKHFYFRFSVETDQLLRQISEDTGLKLSTIVEKALKDYAKIYYAKKNEEF